MRFLGNPVALRVYEEKRVPLKESESEQSRRMNKKVTVDAFVSKMKDYDVISFDVFDTLIFRPFAQPADLFYLVGEKVGMLDFRNIRIWAEWDARQKCNEKNGHMEIDLNDIWENLSEDTGLDAAEGLKIEWETELALCYANPFMLKVWKKLVEMGKRIVIVSDMYLSTEQIKAILEKNGFVGAEKIYVSSNYKKSKADGKLYKLVKEELQKENDSLKILHVGDNPVSDIANAKKAGLEALHYPNINRNELLYRSTDMSFIVGSAYRAIVNAHIYNGLKTFSMEYEYGFIYGGLFVLGYCNFIHNYYVKENLDKLLFLSRDGDILLKAYRILYPEDNAEYAYLSRKAATKLMSEIDRHDYFRRFLYHKVNQEYTIKDILKSMELEFLVDELGDWKDIFLERRLKEEKASKELALKQLDEERANSLEKHPEKAKQIEDKYNSTLRKIQQDFSEDHLVKVRKKDFINLKAKDELTDKNAYLLRRFIEAKWDKVEAVYNGQILAAGKYYGNILGGCKKAAAVDIGWAGSGMMSLYRLANEVWNIPCDLHGIIAGTNTLFNAEPDASEIFLQSGRIVSYMYSQAHNRDLMKKHDPSKGYNVFWELLLSSDTPQFAGFYEKDQRKGRDDLFIDDLDITLRFGKRDVRPYGAAEIQKGILDFVKEYTGHFENYPDMVSIGGRDAYAPVMVATAQNERYLHIMEKKFELEINLV